MNNKDFWDKVTRNQIKVDGEAHHLTKEKNIKGFVDSCDYISSEKFTIWGWVTDIKNGEIKDIRIKGGEEKSKLINIIRTDVSAYYESDKVLKTGFLIDFTAPTTVNTVQVQVMLKNTKVWVTVFDQQLLANRISIPSDKSKVNDHIPGMVVVDDFYTYPNEIRDIALTLNYNPSGYHKGKRTKAKLVLDGTKEKLERILGKEIIGWTAMHDHCGVFQHCTPADPIVYHYDGQTHAAVVFLTPDAPPESGTNFYRSKLTGKTRFEKWENNGSREYDITFQNGNYYDKTKLELIDKIGNVYNRLAIWDARTIHAASEYFGDTKLNSRYFHMFFFDCDNP